MHLTLTFTDPLTLCMSPRIADKREDFPDPTCPTIATSFFFLICKEIFLRVGASSLVHWNVPDSTTIGALILLS